MGKPVNSISMATFLGTALAKATPGVEQNNPIFTLKMTKHFINISRNPGSPDKNTIVVSLAGE